MEGVHGSIMTLREATKMNAGSDCNFLASFCESAVSSAQVKQILNDPKKLQEEMALVQRNLAALQKAEQSMRNPYKRQQVPGKRPKFRGTPRSGVKWSDLCASPAVWLSTSHAPRRLRDSVKPWTISKTESTTCKFGELELAARVGSGSARTGTLDLPYHLGLLCPL